MIVVIFATECFISNEIDYYKFWDPKKVTQRSRITLMNIPFRFFFILQSLLIIISCDNVSFTYDYAIDQPFDETRDKLIQTLIEKEVPYKINKNGSILIKKSDAELVNKIRRKIDDEISPINYSAKFTNLAHAKKFANAIRSEGIPYDLKEIPGPYLYDKNGGKVDRGNFKPVKWYQVVCPPKYFDQANLIMAKYIKELNHSNLNNNLLPE